MINKESVLDHKITQNITTMLYLSCLCHLSIIIFQHHLSQHTDASA